MIKVLVQINNMICEKCGKEFTEDWRKSRKSRKTPCRFCSISCSNSRPKSKKEKEKIKNKLDEHFLLKGKKREKKYCRKCNKEISFNNKSGLCFKCGVEEKRGNLLYCNKCGSKLSFNNKTGTCYKCNNKISLGAEHVKVFRKKKKQTLVDYKGGKCQICGYKKCNSALEFHHLDETKKDFNISHKNIVDIETYKKEVDKCILVCSNCHKEIHVGLIDIKNFK